MLSRIVKIAAAAVAATVVIGIIGHFAGFGDSSGVAFGEVLAHIHNSSYTFDLTTIAEGQTSEAHKGMVKRPGRLRVDDPSGEFSSISDLPTGRHRLLWHRQKVVMMEIPTMPDGPGPFAMLGGPVENLWNLRDGTERPLGRKEVEGQPAVGFEVRQDIPEYACNIVVWARKDSGYPIRVEINLSNPQDHSESVTMVMNHFNLDVELDERLFSLEPPAGYTAAFEKTLDETLADTSATPEGEKVEQALRLWTDGEKDKAIKVLLSVDWTHPMAFSPRAYLFAMTEKGYIALKPDDQKQVFQEAEEAARELRNLLRAVWDLARTERSSRNYAQAETCLKAALNLGTMLSNRLDGMLWVRLLGLSIQRMTLQELKILYEETERAEDLLRTEQQVEAVDATRESILQEVRGR